MTNQLLTYWAQAETQRSNQASEALRHEANMVQARANEIAAQRLAEEIRHNKAMEVSNYVGAGAKAVTAVAGAAKIASIWGAAKNKDSSKSNDKDETNKDNQPPDGGMKSETTTVKQDYIQGTISQYEVDSDGNITIKIKDPKTNPTQNSLRERETSFWSYDESGGIIADTHEKLEALYRETHHVPSITEMLGMFVPSTSVTAWGGIPILGG